MISDKTILISFALFFFSTSIFAADYQLPNNQWRMISLPSAPPADKNTVKEVFGDDIGADADYASKWILYAYDTTINQYKPLTLDSPVKQGKGYWIIQQMGRNVTLKMPAGSIDTPANYALQLTSYAGNIQWNLSGNPFSTPVKLDGFSLVTEAGTCAGQGCSLDEAEENKLLHNQVWVYGDQGYVAKDTPSTLQSWEGFWVAALQNSQSHTLELVYTGGDNNSSDSQYVYQDSEIEIDIKDNNGHIGIWQKNGPDLIKALYDDHNNFVSDKEDSLKLDYRITKKTGGFDVEYTIENKTDAPIKLPILQIPGIQFGDSDTNQLNIVNPLFTHYLEDRSLENEKEAKYEVATGKDYERIGELGENVFSVGSTLFTQNDGRKKNAHLPYGSQFVYSPVIVANNNVFTAGASLNFDWREKSDLKAYMSIEKEPQGWMYKFDLRASDISANKTLKMVISVRFSKPEQWIFTLYPYKDFFNKTYQRDITWLNNHEKDVSPIHAVTFANNPDEPKLNKRQWAWPFVKNDLSDEKLNVENSLNILGAALNLLGFKRTMIWNFTGSYDRSNGECGDRYSGCINEQLPFQFLVDPKSEGDIYEADNNLLQGFKASMQNIIDNKKDYGFEMGYDWGIAGSIPLGLDEKPIPFNIWSPEFVVPYELGNSDHTTYARHYLQSVSSLKDTFFEPKFIRLDAFVRMELNNRLTWLKELKGNLKKTKFAAESSIDYMHAQIPMINQLDTTETPQGSFQDIKKPDLLAYYLNPGMEVIVNLDIEFFNKGLRQEKEDYMKKLVQMGYTPLVGSKLPFMKTMIDGVRYEEAVRTNGLSNNDIGFCFDNKQENGEWPYGTCLSRGNARSGK